MTSTWHSMWLEDNRVCDILQYLISVPDVFDICHHLYLTPVKCVCDILQTEKLILMIAFALF